MRLTSIHTAIAIAAASAVPAFAQVQGPSTGSTPYATAITPSKVTTYSIATVDNTGVNADDSFNKIGGGAYGMVGIPDGMGAFDNGDRTFTVLMNHEIGNAAGVLRDHGSVGSFVSKWIINKDTFAVVEARDLIKNVNLWNGSSYTTFNTASPIVTGPASAPGYNAAIGRLCSGDLPEISAFKNGNLGTSARIFMSGEEIGAEGRAFAHVVTGAEAGTSYQLPRLGKFSWENAVASPVAQNKTVVMGLDDTTPGEAYLYVGNKTASGSEVDKAGLTNGLLYGIKVDGGSPQAENRTTDFGIGKGGSKAFSLVLAPNGGDVTSVSGAALQTAHAIDLTTNFLRPEDGAWDTVNPNRFYFVTTDRYDQVKDGTGAQVGRSRLWALDFTDIANPENGGAVKLLLDGAETLAQGGQNMMDNIAVDVDGNVIIVEDVGNQQHNGKISRYNPTTGQLEILAQHDAARFGDIGLPASAPFNTVGLNTNFSDEEFSGVLDLTSIMSDSSLTTVAGQRWYLFNDQSHYNGGITTAQVEGGQLLALSVIPEPTSLGLIGAAGAMLLRRTRRGR